MDLRKESETAIKISAIIPCMNEEGNIRQVYERISKALSIYEDFELIFLDNASSDNTLQLVKSLAERDPKVKYIAYSKNVGFERSFRNGFEYASFEWCVQYDADLQSPPEETHKLVEKTRQGYDVVFGVREDRDDPFYRVAGSHLLQWTAKHLFRIDVPKGASVFRILRTSIARDIIHFPTRATYFIATVPLVTSRYALVTTAHHARQWGKSKYGFQEIFSHSFELFFGFSQIPLLLSWFWFFLTMTAFICFILIGDSPDGKAAVYVGGEFFLSSPF
ncbi:MAG: glycosyltransferase [Desulfobacteraceae bacterium]|nr:MAG: glycosyltransferase [Desulfobacteraceae bacterium]